MNIFVLNRVRVLGVLRFEMPKPFKHLTEFYAESIPAKVSFKAV